MCHLAAPEHQLARSWAVSVSRWVHPSLPLFCLSSCVGHGRGQARELACPPDPAWCVTCDVPAQQYLKLSTRVTVALSKEPPFLLPVNCLISSPCGGCAVQVSICDAFLVPQQTTGRDLQGFRLPRRTMKEGWRVARATFPMCCSTLVISVQDSQQTALTFPACAAAVVLGSLICPGSTMCALETCRPN